MSKKNKASEDEMKKRRLHNKELETQEESRRINKHSNWFKRQLFNSVNNEG